MPIMRRLPKRGFYSFTKKLVQIVNIGDLKDFKETDEISPELLFKKGMIRSKDVPVKILGDGELKTKISVSANAFSKSAKEKIEAAGGRITLL